MADHYIAATGSNTSPYSSWATAANSATTAVGDALAAMVAGDRLFIDKTFVQSSAVALTHTFPGTDVSPNIIQSVTNTGNPVTAADIAAGATITTTGTSAQTWNGAISVFGLTLNIGTGGSPSNLTTNSVAGSQYWDTCAFRHKSTAGTSSWSPSTAAGSRCEVVNTPVEFNGAASCNIGGSSNGFFIWRNTPNALQGATISSTLLNGASKIVLDGMDFTALGAGRSLYGTGLALIITAKNCKFGASTVFPVPTARGCWFDGVGVDIAGNTVSQVRRRYEGSLTGDGANYNTASDGTTPHSWLVATTANCSLLFPFECTEIVQWVLPGTYSASTITFTCGAAGLTNADVWCEAEYLASASSTLGTTVSSGVANLLTAGTPLNAGGSWLVGGFANKYIIAIPPFTQALAGWVRFKIKIARPGTSFYIDPKVTVA